MNTWHLHATANTFQPLTKKTGDLDNDYAAAEGLHQVNWFDQNSGKSIDFKATWPKEIHSCTVVWSNASAAMQPKLFDAAKINIQQAELVVPVLFASRSLINTEPEAIADR